MYYIVLILKSKIEILFHTIKLLLTLIQIRPQLPFEHLNFSQH